MRDGDERRPKFDKKTGKVIIITDKKEKPDNDFFEAQEASGEQFMAVRPYIGAIVEPDNRKLLTSSSYLNASLDPPVNPAKPDTIYNLEYVYGYRCADSR